jgi:alkylresorcinol/alkylpyrone synthase
MTVPVRILSLATVSPPHELTQDQALAAARELLAPHFPGFARMAPVFRSAGIRTRQCVMPVEWYFTPRNWPERTEAYLAGAVELFARAAEGALSEAGLTGAQVDAIVTVSSTGIATPSLEARAMDRLGFRPDAQRIPVFGLGCAGGATGLSLAARLARADPGAVVLFVCVELCTLAFRTDKLSKADIVATALFGDGAAACVLQAGEAGFAEVTGETEHTWPDTLDIMGWRVDPDGLGVIFAQAIPPSPGAGCARSSTPPLPSRTSPSPTSTASSAIPAGPRSSRPWSARWTWGRAPSTWSARCWPTTATCPRPPCSSCWTGRAVGACPSVPW